MQEPTAVLADPEYQPKSLNALADYDDWFAKAEWTLHDAAALFVGLNPEIVFDPATIVAYDKFSVTHPIMYQLWRYEEEMWDWREISEKFFSDFRDYYCASELDGVIDKKVNADRAYDTVTFKPMDFIQWTVDENIPMHYRLKEYLAENGYDFRFSKNSQILSQFQIHGRKEIWSMPEAARLVLGLNPESPKIRLVNRKNLYRHLDPNYSFTQRDEVYHVMELALESWKTKNLEFFEINGDNPEEKYYDDEECGVSVEAKKFVTWAISKGFKPPEQLLEFMGLKPAKQNETNKKPRRDDALENSKVSEDKVSDNPKNPYWIEFSDASGEVVLNGLFTVAKPETNGQNYKIIKYLIANPNKFVTADDLKANALGGKNLDKRLTDFAAQINMNKDFGKLFFDTGNDSIRLNNPVTPERLTEQNIRRVRIKPA
jgi:hypothetical protein